ncbi:uncharacterized protein LOC132700141 [Cylas formicarius]|uniref:uncharacterized protein LOC132700141 n=1 Tax=Cylas formicarius TaxID=197179 RepID=UPI002958410B|nr:uncharacterized protein LOC132700141 [Cylas formicarius]XP_060523255.1 uncharacterized protein LOC132700141 [Cylas formicarius]
MSDDGFPDCPEQPNMEIQIKTLMGTSFDIKVSGSDTIGDIKKKIFRVEGIPIYQQNLIFKSEELKDAHRLCDLGIKNGSTLTLVSAMRGGPISTRRLSVTCELHLMMKELKDLLENAREEIGPGSKVSVLVFKEGEIINLLRVIENEDGSYSPYSENNSPISPPTKHLPKDSAASSSSSFKNVVEDTEMCAKIAGLRKKMADATARRRNRAGGGGAAVDCGSSSSASDLPFKFLEDITGGLLDAVDLTVYERSFTDEGNQSESEEIALKDKHRTKLKPKSLYSERKGAYSRTKQNYAWMHNKRDSRLFERSARDDRPNLRLENSDAGVVAAAARSPAVEEVGAKLAEQLHFIDDDDNQNVFGESLSVSAARNRVHLTRLVLSEGAERPKSSPDGIELEEHGQDLWEIHEPATERLKHSATCKVGVLKRRQGLEYNYEGLENASTSKIKPEIGNYGGKASTTEFGVYSGANFYMPQFMSTPSAIPPQYAPKEPDYCDLFFAREPRSPLYSRRNRKEAEETSASGAKDSATDYGPGLLGDCASIQRLKNECGGEAEAIFGPDNELADDLYGYYNLGCSADRSDERTGGVEPLPPPPPPPPLLPPVAKKRSRCGECNRRLNITNIYSCRCGRMFCSQHRYSEVHRCTYDYKTEGRRLLEHQNPLVAAEKVKRI